MRRGKSSDNDDKQGTPDQTRFTAHCIPQDGHGAPRQPRCDGRRVPNAPARHGLCVARPCTRLAGTGRAGLPKSAVRAPNFSKKTQKKVKSRENKEGLA